VKAKKNVLIITDGAPGTEKMSAILPADAFFLGCEKAAPDSFAYLTDLLKHINLAGRTCGVFSSGTKKTAGYLAGLVKDCEAALNPELLTSSASDIKNWTQKTISRSF